MKFKLLKSFDNQLIWCDVSTGHNRPYLTAKFRRKVFSNSHSLGHPSHRATKPLINTRFVWHGMNIDIGRWCRTCKGCQTAKVSRHNTPVFGKFTKPTERFDHVHIDIVGPLPYSESYHELSPPVEWHGRTFSPSIESHHYGARVTEPVDYHVTRCAFRSSFRS